MHHPQQHLVDLSEILFRRGVSRVVISPGSRNAPLIRAFVQRFGTACISLVDERSAAYAALGIARQSQTPAVLICTSGTAVLNLAPALAEAYYQNIPLIAITADRPAEWIDQQDNQTIRQPDIYKNYIKTSFNLAEAYPGDKEMQEFRNLIQTAYSASVSAPLGPVHLNVPIPEPLYISQPKASSACDTPWEETKLPQDESLRDLVHDWKNAKNILVVLGQHWPDPQLQNTIELLCNDERVIVIAENVSNVYTDQTISLPELLLARIVSGALPYPDLLLYSGGQVVSKRLKQFLRNHPIAKTWRIGRDAYLMDTFRQNNRHCKHTPYKTYALLTQQQPQAGTPNGFRKAWLAAQLGVRSLRNESIPDLPFSDFKAVHQILQQLPSGTIADLGNSSIIRLAQLCDSRQDICYHSNRGVSGIDGCVSSAVGGSLATRALTVSLVGDLSFLYDSNALWNRHLPDNFRLVVLNNQGGGIFGLLPGSADAPFFNNFLRAHHPVDLQKLVEAYKLNYFCANTEDRLAQCLPAFLAAQAGASVLEINTLQEHNLESFNTLMGNR